MILIDTSVWIDVLKGTANQKLTDFVGTHVINENVAIIDLIRYELLIGCKTNREFSDLIFYLSKLEQIVFNHDSWNDLIDFGYNLKRKGLTIPLTDVMISYVAIKNNLELLHNDRHFNLIASHENLQLIQNLL